jgi:anti-sigma B factor antagonist
MDLTSQRFADALVVRVAGRLDHDTSAGFCEQLAKLIEEPGREGQAIILDLAGLDYISSSGLNGLMVASRQAKALQRRLYVAALQPLATEMFEVSHLNLLLEVFSSVREALGMVSSRAVAAFDAATP